MWSLSYLCLFLAVLLTSASNTLLLNFDDVPTKSGLGNLSNPYHHLAFSAYNVFAPADPALKDIIPVDDHNCAVSSPNALIGSRDKPNPEHASKGAYFYIGNPSAMTEEGVRPYFTLKTFYVKPINTPESTGTNITVKGYKGNDTEPSLSWHVHFPSDYHLPFFVKIQEDSGDVWEELYGVEITADFGEDELDWEFCLDDLEVEFFGSENETGESMVQEGERRGAGQDVLAEDMQTWEL
ncbi:MAG: hypothetical protein Q9181_003929 [Wetmoreana brouardii]